MRELKFRGLNANGELVYGHLVPDLPNSTTYYKEYSQRICWYEGTSHCNQPVRNGTVGQFTGLFDKNGKEIYEGDILKHELWGNSEIIWEHGMFRGVSKEHDITLADHQLKRSEVIGNIHEPKSLLEQADQ